MLYRFIALLICISFAFSIAQDSDTKKDANIDNNSENTIFLDRTKIESQDNKPMLIVFGKKDCYHCKMLWSSMIDNDTIHGYISLNFSAYYIDLDSKKRYSIPYLNISGVNAINVARLYKIIALPTIVFVSSDSIEILKIIGFPGEKRLISMLEFINNDVWKNYDNPKERVKAFLEGEATK